MTDPRDSVEPVVDYLVVAVKQDAVPVSETEAGDEDWASLAYYAVTRGTGEWTPDIHETSPLAVLDVLGTDVPREYRDYIGTIVECEGKPKYPAPETVLEAMALRKLEQTVYERLADQ